MMLERAISAVQAGHWKAFRILRRAEEPDVIDTICPLDCDGDEKLAPYILGTYERMLEGGL